LDLARIPFVLLGLSGFVTGAAGLIAAIFGASCFRCVMTGWRFIFEFPGFRKESESSFDPL
jgi:hypothetical protein